MASGSTSRIPITDNKRRRSRTNRLRCICAAAALVIATCSTSSVVVQAGHLALPLQAHHRLVERQRGAATSSSAAVDGDSVSATSTTAGGRGASASATSSGSGTGSGTATATGSAPSASASADPFAWPQAFDSITTSSFVSSTCPAFFQTFLNDPMILSSPPDGCMPLSLLIGTSNSFFKTERQPNTSLVTVLDAACSPTPGADACTDKMAQLQMQLQSSCSKDLQVGNAFAVQARDGFRSYAAVREATCSKNPSTNQYCFVDAVAAKSPSDLYFFLLAQGTSLPSGTNASCSACNQNLMQIYSKYATNGSLPLSAVYANARTMGSVSCGPNFAPLVQTPVRTSSASSLLHIDATSLFTSITTATLALASITLL